MNKKIIILILIIGIVSYFSVTFFIPAFLYAQSDKLGLILYNCTLGFERSGPLMLLNFDNGTHTIDENSCKWIKNKIP